MPPKKRIVSAKEKSEKSKEDEEATEMLLPDESMEAEAEVAAAVDHLLFTPEKEPAEELPAITQPVSAASLSVARNRLTTLLSKIHKEEAELEASRSTPIIEAIAADDADGRDTPTTKSKGDPLALPGKKRKRREVQEAGGPHHSYVMKLFDRSVDLAQFNEKTALYPVCRAWMANKPRHVPKPAPTDSDDEFDYFDFGTEDITKMVRKLPAPEAKAEIHNRVPHKLPEKSNQELSIKQENDESLLEMHKQHWRQVKKDWVQAAFNNETRYTKSIKMIEDIFKRGQEMYS